MSGLSPPDWSVHPDAWATPSEPRHPAGPPGGPPRPPWWRPWSEPADKLETVLTVAMVVAAVLGAVIAWRASVLSGQAGGAYDRGIEQLIQREQAEAQNESRLLHDLRMHARYQEHVRAWRLLQQQAAETRPTDPVLADQLDLQAQERLALARAMQPYFLAAAPDFGDAQGTVAYDRDYVRRYLRSITPQLRELRPDQTFAAGKALNDSVVRLVGLVLLSVVALFFLTLAELTGSHARVLLAVLGGVVLIGAGGLFAFVGFT